MNILELRRKTGFSQSEFSAYIGVPLKTLQNWEQGTRKPPDYLICLVEKVLRYEGVIDYEK